TARRAGHDVGRDQVARLMRAAGIEGVCRGKRVRTTKADPGAGVASSRVVYESDLISGTGVS
ncbi:hypothetical protein QYF68_00960, partial [Mycolicibacterium austroafricanum]|nr:hypothetical protein [Mycolicibacterium austroafricanum]